MSVLDLDAPQSCLRLVVTNGQATSRDERLRSGASLYGDARVLYREVLQEALANGLALEADALRVVLATKQATNGGPLTTFTSADIWQLMFVDIVTWCRNRRIDVPGGCARALGCVITFLDETDSLHENSDSLEELHEAIEECTGGWGDPHPSIASQATHKSSTTSAASRTAASGRRTRSSPSRSLRSSRGTKRT